MKQIFTLIFFAFITNFVYAGFPIGKGKYLIVPSYNLYTAKGYWNESGSYTDYTNNGRFASHYFGLYGGLGLTEKLDFVGNINYTIQRKMETNFTEQNASLGDATVGLQYLMNSFDYYKFLTFSGSLIVPLYQNNPSKTPYTGFQQVGGEVKMAFSGTNRERLKNTYYDVNVGLRQYFSAEGPTQIFFDALFGLPLNEMNKLTFSMSGNKSNSSTSVFNFNNLSANRSFSYFRLTTGYGRKIDQNYQFFITLFTDVTGKNTGKGGGGAISIVAEL